MGVCCCVKYVSASAAGDKAVPCAEHDVKVMKSQLSVGDQAVVYNISPVLLLN